MAVDRVYRFLCHVPGRRDLGLYQRDLPDAGPGAMAKEEDEESASSEDDDESEDAAAHGEGRDKQHGEGAADRAGADPRRGHRLLDVAAVAIARVGEVDAALAVDRQVVGRVKVLALVAVDRLLRSLGALDQVHARFGLRPR